MKRVTDTSNPTIRAGVCKIREGMRETIAGYYGVTVEQIEQSPQCAEFTHRLASLTFNASFVYPNLESLIVRHDRLGGSAQIILELRIPRPRPRRS